MGSTLAQQPRALDGSEIKGSGTNGSAQELSREHRADDFGVLVGWSHTPFNRGIDLRVQSAAQAAAGQIDNRHYLMTKNQALILAKYLLDVTGQELPPRKRPGMLKRLFSAAKD